MVQDDFIQQVREREVLSSTEVGNLVALPHPQHYQGEDIIVCLLALKEPITWKYGEVQLIIFMALPSIETEQSRMLTQWITHIVGDRKIVMEMIADLSLQHLKQLYHMEI